MSETGEDRLVMYAQMASLVQQMVAPEEVDVKEVTQTICRVSPSPKSPGSLLQNRQHTSIYSPVITCRNV